MTTVRTLARALHPADHLDAFDPDAILGLPEPARRWLTHAIEPGLPLVDAVELEMHGEVRLGNRWLRFTAIEALVPDSGFVWSAHTRLAGLPVSGYDAYVNGAGSMRWRLLGLPLQSAHGPDVTRSAAGRLASECVQLPTSLVEHTWTAGAEHDRATYVHRIGSRPANPVTIDVGADGTLHGVSVRRWGNPDGTGYATYPFEVRFGSEFRIDGMILPNDISARWVEPDGRHCEFFHAALDRVEFYVRGLP
jgi:hypothetical protein